MKNVYYLLYCSGELSPETVTYYVRVGRSDREQKAHRRLLDITSGDHRFFYAKACAEVSDFISRIRDSWVTPNPFRKTYWFRRFRCISVSPCQLESFLRKFPGELLNSLSAEKIFQKS